MKKEYLKISTKDNSMKTLKYLKALYKVLNNKPNNYKDNETIERLLKYKDSTNKNVKIN